MQGDCLQAQRVAFGNWRLLLSEWVEFLGGGSSDGALGRSLTGDPQRLGAPVHVFTLTVRSPALGQARGAQHIFFDRLPRKSPI